MATTYREEPDHAVLPDAGAYDVVGVNVRLVDECTVELTIQRGAVIRRLAFRGARGVRFEQPIEGGYTLMIKDVSGRGLDGIRVLALYGDEHGVEQNECLRLWAREVEEIGE